MELAKASAPQYGIYMDGVASIEKLIDSIDKLGDLVLPILESDTDDLVKLKAIELIESSIVPPVFNPNGVNVTMSK